MTVVVSDSFNRANGALGTPDIGPAWQVMSGSPAVSNNQIAVNNGTCGVESGVADCVIQATNTLAADNAAIYFRIQNNDNLLRLRRSGTQLLLQKKIATASTTVATLSANFPFANGDVWKIVCSGPSITVYINDVQVGATSTITELATQTIHGFGAFPSTTALFDDFSVDDAVPGGGGSGVNASASGTLSLTGSASAAALVAATASGALALSGSAAASVASRATAAGALQLVGSATAAVLVQATAAGSLTLAGSATVGTPAIHATASGSLALRGSAAATIRIAATAIGGLALTGTASIAVLDRASVSGTLHLAGSARAGVLVTARAQGALLFAGRATLLHPGLVLPLDSLIFGPLTPVPPSLTLGPLAPVPGLQFGPLTPVAPSLTVGPLTPVTD